MKTFLLTTGLIFFSAGNILAVDLTNNDAQAHQVKITEGSNQPTQVSIEPGATKSICSSDCQIEVDGIGSVNAKSKDKIEIEEGKIVLPTTSL
jgi:hypothetical protein